MHTCDTHIVTVSIFMGGGGGGGGVVVCGPHYDPHGAHAPMRTTIPNNLPIIVMFLVSSPVCSERALSKFVCSCYGPITDYFKMAD